MLRLVDPPIKPAGWVRTSAEEVNRSRVARGEKRAGTRLYGCSVTAALRVYSYTVSQDCGSASDYYLTRASLELPILAFVL